ncbi:MAG: DNA (cytosine-5-)-methyltransferase [Desulfosarcina sp.]|nr:DNA (cytosine-5-)-methyltransferase [Desulfosarcina sp.]
MQNNQSQTEFSQLREQTGLSIEDLSGTLGFSTRTLYRWDRGETKPRQAAIIVLKNIAARKRESIPEEAKFEFIDLFAGIGGLRRGFNLIGGKCVFTSEWNKYSQQTYRANFESEHEIAGDITQINAAEIPVHDVLLAGFPCQPFSIAGVSKKNALNRPHGFLCEAQGTLFFDVARIIEYHRPKAFLLENVKNLVNHDKGKTFKIIHHVLKEELGYHIRYKVIDARSWVPQHRERIFIAGFREKCDFSFDNFAIPDPVSGPRLGTVLHPENGSEPEEMPYTLGEKALVSPKYTLSDLLWNYLQGYAEKHRKKGNGFGFGLVGPDDVARTLSARYYKDGSEILVRQEGRNPRRLTPRECARLMGFDKPDGKDFIIPVSDTQAYKQFGNAVAVPVVSSIARHMAHRITGEPQQLQVFPTHEELAACG